MAVFTYEAVDNKGKKIKADVEASNTQDAINKVHKMGLFPTTVKPKGGEAGGAGGAPIKGKGGKAPFTFGGVSQKQLTTFTVQLSILQDAGLPLVRSLKILSGQMKPCLLKNIVEQVADDVESGSSLSEALSKHPKAFDKLYVNMVKAGEAGGVLDTILQRLAAFMEKAQKLKRKVIGASIYPVAVMSIAVLIVAGIMVFVIPQFKKVFDDMKMALPFVTSILLTISEFVAGFWFLIPAFPILLVLGIKIMNRNKAGKLMLDKLKLHMPLFGNIMRKATISRFCRTLGTLITSGVPILEALAIVRGAIGNEVVSNAIQTVHDSIREGESIADPLAQSGIFDDIVINMIDVGEETGELDKMLVKIADNYDEEVDAAVEGLMSILEPAMIIGMGGTIGFIVIALFMPLIDLIKGMQG
ncbi:MAG: type II secretion system F family protein [Planctomycetes bacterium]|nr:type II secretion system F family protein [Planctomycetota bacterium]